MRVKVDALRMVSGAWGHQPLASQRSRGHASARRRLEPSASVVHGSVAGPPRCRWHPPGAWAEAELVQPTAAASRAPSLRRAPPRPRRGPSADQRRQAKAEASKLWPPAGPEPLAKPRSLADPEAAAAADRAGWRPARGSSSQARAPASSSDAPTPGTARPMRRRGSARACPGSGPRSCGTGSPAKSWRSPCCNQSPPPR